MFTSSSIDGNVAIAPTDFERPLSFSFGDGSRILSAEIIKTYPITLKPTLNLLSNRVSLEPVLLNGNDTLTIKLLIFQYGGQVIPDARAAGVREKRGIAGSQVSVLKVTLLFLLYLIAGSTVASFVRPKGSINWFDAILVLSSYILATIGVSISFMIPFRGKKIEKH